MQLYITNKQTKKLKAILSLLQWVLNKILDKAYNIYNLK